MGEVAPVALHGPRRRALGQVVAVAGAGPGQGKRAKFPTSKAPLSVMFHSFRLILGRAIISRSTLEAWILFLEQSRAELSC